MKDGGSYRHGKHRKYLQNAFVMPLLQFRVLSKFRDYFCMKDGGSDRHGKHRKYLQSAFVMPLLQFRVYPNSVTTFV
jgi:hypothetical protein